MKTKPPVPHLTCPHCGAQDEIARLDENTCMACGRLVDDPLGNGEATHAVVYLFTSEQQARAMRALQNHGRGILMEWPLTVVASTPEPAPIPEPAIQPPSPGAWPVLIPGTTTWSN